MKRYVFKHGDGKGNVCVEGQRTDLMDNFENPLDWAIYNQNIFVENRNRLNNNKRRDEVRQAIEAMAPMGKVVFVDVDLKESKSCDTAVEEMLNNDKDIEYSAYFHYFVAKQNRKKAYEWFEKWRDNLVEYLEQRSEYREGDYLQKCKEVKGKANGNEKILKLMDLTGWWGKRIGGMKIYKIACCDKAFTT